MILLFKIEQQEELNTIDDFKKAWNGTQQIFNENENLLIKFVFPSYKYWTKKFSEGFFLMNLSGSSFIVVKKCFK